jgi:hypothetical protein
MQIAAGIEKNTIMRIVASWLCPGETSASVYEKFSHKDGSLT